MDQLNLENILKVGFLNIRGQTGLTNIKQLQIKSFLNRENLDILHLQELKNLFPPVILSHQASTSSPTTLPISMELPP